MHAAAPTTHPRPAVFLDRDDTINQNADLPDAAWEGVKPGDLLKPEFARLLPGARQALVDLKAAGFVIIVITNQGGVARGGGSTTDIDGVNDQLRLKLRNCSDKPETADPGLLAEPECLALFEDQPIDCSYACPFHPTGSVPAFAREHRWRKPGGGMIEAAAREHSLDLARSWMVGDKQRDLDAARSAGVPSARCLLVGTTERFETLADAAAHILSLSHQAGQTVPASRVTLKAQLTTEHPRPLQDSQIRETVLSSARALAERSGVRILDVHCSDTALTTTLATARLPALGFAAELRRLTNAWSKRHLDYSLWLDPDQPHDDT